MSQQSLASKTITKRNVAQSSVIFSVVVAVITLSVIATVAYVDITQDNDTASLEKSITDLIAEQKTRLAENHTKVELLSQSEDLVSSMDQRVEDLKQLDEKVKKVDEQLNFIATSLQSNLKPITSPHSVKPVATVKAVQHVDQPSFQNNNSANYQQYINSIFDQNSAVNVDASQQLTADGEAYFEISWLFKGRSKVTMDQQSLFQSYLKNQSAWNAKTL